MRHWLRTYDDARDLKEILAMAMAMAIREEALTSGRPQNQVTYGQDPRTISRKLPKTNREEIKRLLTGTIRNLLQGYSRGLTRNQLKEHLRSDPNYIAARNNRIKLEVVVDSMISQGMIKFVEGDDECRLIAIGPQGIAIALPSAAALIDENCHTAHTFLMITEHVEDYALKNTATWDAANQPRPAFARSIRWSFHVPAGLDHHDLNEKLRSGLDALINDIEKEATNGDRRPVTAVLGLLNGIPPTSGCE